MPIRRPSVVSMCEVRINIGMMQQSLIAGVAAFEGYPDPVTEEIMKGTIVEPRKVLTDVRQEGIEVRISGRKYTRKSLYIAWGLF